MKTILTTLLLSACGLVHAAVAVAPRPGTPAAERRAKFAARRAKLAAMSPEERKAYVEAHRAAHAIKMASMTPEEKAALEAKKKAAKESLDARLFVARMLKHEIEGVTFIDGKYVIMYKGGKTATVDPKGL